ncbi:MAG: hypothetical protein ACRDRT_10955, partial [Pseudonocardiaceae bacterium]
DVGRTCPNINMTDRGTYIVQGYLATGLDLDGQVLGSGESVVKVPSSLLPELAVDETAYGALRHTDRGTVLVCGNLVVDVETLRELCLPAGEVAVEVPISALPELEFVHAR